MLERCPISIWSNLATANTVAFSASHSNFHVCLPSTFLVASFRFFLFYYLCCFKLKSDAVYSPVHRSVCRIVVADTRTNTNTIKIEFHIAKQNEKCAAYINIYIQN